MKKYECSCGSTRYYESVTLHSEELWEVDCDGDLIEVRDEGERSEKVTGVICAGCNALLKTEEESK
jgi:hypothetical protein